MEQPFTAASHHDVLVLLVQIVVLLFTARLLGEIAQRLGQPSVVGEILAGVLLGPSFLSGLIPVLGDWIVPQTPVQGYLLEVISLLGVMFLLLITGLETDLALIRRQARTAFGVSFGGIIVTFATGFVLGQFLPDDLLVDPERRLTFALFVATSMSISAIPVIAKVLIDLNLTRRDVGQTIIAAGMSDDTIGWILLSVVTGLATSGLITFGAVASSVGNVLFFLVVSFTLGRLMVRRLLRLVQRGAIGRERVLALVVILTFGWATFTQALHIEPVLGAFVMGILFSMMPNLPSDVVHKLEGIALGVFAPIFFAVAGLKVNVTSLLQPRLLLVAAVVIFVATFGKVVGTYLGARLIGRRDHWTALSFGAGLNARGAMEIIIATIGLNLGILTQDMFSVIVVMAITTSLMAPTALRWVLKRVEVTEEEMRRLEQEELLADNLIANVHRVLLPVRTGRGATPVRTVEAQILQQLGAGNNRLEITLFSVAPKGKEAEVGRYLDDLSGLFKSLELSKKVVVGDNPGNLILDEAAKGYDLILLGATDKTQDASALFNPVTDYVVRLAPCPTMVIHSPHNLGNWKLERILVPTNGSQAAKRAAEVGFALAASDEDIEVSVLNVVTSEKSYQNASDAVVEHQMNFSQQIVDELQTVGVSLGVPTSGQVQVGSEPETVIVTTAEQENVNLIILGVDVRPGSSRLFLGPMVEHILDNAHCAVLVVNA